MGAGLEPAVSLDQVIELASERPNGQAIQAFARAYLRRPAGEPDRNGATAAELLAEVEGAFSLAAGRRAPVAVRAFTPRRAEHGYDTDGSVLETNTEDLPFLVDSVTAEIRARGHTVRRVVHPIVGTERGDDGAIVRVAHPHETAGRESVMHFELAERLSPEALAELEDGVRAVLTTVRQVVDAYPDLVQRVDRMIAIARAAGACYGAEEIEETVTFLEWLRDDHFVFLGYREYEIVENSIRVVDGTGLGVLADASRSAYARPVPLDALEPAFRERVLHGDLLIVGRTNRRSPVRRRERMEYIGVRIVGPDGQTAGEARLLGLFASRAYAEPASATPLLQRKLRRIIEAEDLIAGSHDYKAAVHLFDAFPKDELFAAPVADLGKAIGVLLALQGDEVRLLARRDADGRTASLIAALPGARYSAELRDRLRDTVRRAYRTEHIEVHEVVGDSDRVQLHFTVHADEGLPEVDTAALQRHVRRLARTWHDQVAEVLVGEHGAERGRMLAARWFKRLPDAYRAATGPDHAAEDIRCLEALVTGGEGFLVGLQNAPGRTRVTLYKEGPKVELSQATPMLEHLGLRVIEEVPTRLEGDGEAWLQSFSVLGPRDAPLDLDDCRARVGELLAAVWRGESESDSLNRLVISAGLDWRQVEILRAQRRYRQRIGSRYTEGFQNDVIAANPEITAKLVRLFELRFRPDIPFDAEAERELRAEISADLDAVELLDHDRILRNQLGLTEATVRTNVYRRDRDVMAFKLRSADVPAIPLPAPLFEIYVYAPDMEGIHLRGGRIARGGLRWSDRMDYRTEVYGLLRAQMTKNAVIVPTGAKGGFFLKEPGDVRGQYIRYINALLDVTDDLVEGRVVPPDGVRVHDEDDTYLVVAADKGTATFSDTANEIAMRRGFWLGDAFASGGSTGYDHKALGITARGAWESVKRHFREMGADPEADVISAVGIGDMSGDVFGNGMLLSRTLKLVAAYDHRHVFIDPDPDPAESHAERRRLFELPGSSWADYNPELISEGGGVWPRTLKSVPLSDQARAALGIADSALPPTEVIRAILRAPVDLLWNGGIGTVVKCSTETDADALDRSSDAIRVDGRDLRAKVVGEGGNLGFTQRARIEFSRNGGRVNADFIDNSAGVDCSDHEVNLKILLDLAVNRGSLSVEERNALLLEVTGDVVEHVLEDSRLQAQILAQEARLASARMFAYEDLMDALEAEGLLERAVEFLPAPDELAERRRAGRGLERPELAVLVAYAKRSVTDALLRSRLPDDPFFERDLRAYFPTRVVERFGDLIAEHPLRRELVATLAANDVVDSLGPTFVSRMASELGVEPAEAVRAFCVAREVTGARERWDAIERLNAGLDDDTHWELMAGVDDLVEDVARWHLLHAPGADLIGTVATGREGFARLDEAMRSLRSEGWREGRDTAADELTARGVPEDIACAHAFQPALVHAPDIIATAHVTGRRVEEVAQAFYDLGEGLRLEWLEREIDELPAATRLQRWAVHAVRDDVLGARRLLAQRALEDAPQADAETAVEGFLESREGPRRRLASFTRALALEGTTDLAGLSLAVRHLMALAGAAARDEL